MSPEDRDTLERDILDALPENYGYIVITLPIGVPAKTHYMSNMDRDIAAMAMREILSLFDQQN